MKTYDKIYIGGEWVPSSGKGHFDVIDASTEEVMGRVPAGTAEDVSRAVERAAAAFPAWSRDLGRRARAVTSRNCSRESARG